ncbi:MAG: nickel-binding protein [Pseudomonadota bacterium]
MLKAFCAVTAMTMAASSLADTTEPSQATHRYLIERTFPTGAIDGVDAAVKKKVNANNATLNVTWEKSYANPDKTKLYCVYDGPSEAAVRDAAKLNGLPVDNVAEIPADIKPEPRGAVQHIAAGNHRYLVKRAGVPGASASGDSKFGVTLLTSYATADRHGSFWVYEAPSFSAVESAAKAAGAPFESIAEIPETVYPH